MCHHKAQLDFSRPDKPTDNGFVETFNDSLYDECLNVNGYLKQSMAQRNRQVIVARKFASTSTI
jgi:putative transposase